MNDKTRHFTEQIVELFVQMTRLAEIWGGNYVIRSINLIEVINFRKFKYNFVVFDGVKELELKAIVEVGEDALNERKLAEIVPN